MKTYSKDDVISTVRDMLQDITEVESVEHLGGNEFAVCIVIKFTSVLTRLMWRERHNPTYS